MCKVLPKRPVVGVACTNFVSKLFDIYAWMRDICLYTNGSTYDRWLSSIVFLTGSGTEINKKIDIENILSDVFGMNLIYYL